jgi:hypothetical protein
LLDFSAIFGLTARILGQKAEISIPGNEEPKFLTGNGAYYKRWTSVDAKKLKPSDRLNVK